MLRFFASGIRTILAAACVMLAIALAPHVPTALATARTTTINVEAKPSPLGAAQSCAAFEVWFLNPTCSKLHVEKAARTKRHLAHN